VCCVCLSRLVVLVLLSSLRGRCVGCIWGGVGVGWRACVDLWRRAERSLVCRFRAIAWCLYASSVSSLLCLVVFCLPYAVCVSLCIFFYLWSCHYVH